MIIAVDHGNSAIKTVHHSFPSGLTESLTEPPMAERSIHLKDRFWTPSGRRIPYMRDKTRDDRFFILTLFAVMMELESAGGLDGTRSRRIDLAVGLPPEHFSAQREAFQRYLKRDVRFRYGELLFDLSIDRVMAYPQAYAAVACRFSELKDFSRVFIVDIGGYTTDVLLLRNGKPDMDYCHSFDLGMILMKNEIARIVNAKYDLQVEDDHIGDVLAEKHMPFPADVIAAIRMHSEAYAKHILDTLRENEINLRTAPVVFLGGGSLLLQEFLVHSSMVENITIESDTRANAKGYDLLARAQLKSS